MDVIESPSTFLVLPEWCEHRPQLIVRADGKQVLQCHDCGYVLQEWSVPIRVEHFDHA
jgi:hypothetical protein